ncbi:MAG: EsaB/YukD family protein [Ktedonobacterales bacterium]|nr:EsaB/YukD family protein [Ktedonobacterales bacterium]
MGERTTRVTVRGAQADIDVDLPNAVPIQDLLPVLLMALAMGTGNPTLDSAEVWGLGKLGATQPLAPQMTLMAAQVFDGEELRLQDMAAWRQSQQPQRTVPQAIEPDEHGLGVRWQPVEGWQEF